MLQRMHGLKKKKHPHTPCSRTPLALPQNARSNRSRKKVRLLRNMFISSLPGSPPICFPCAPLIPKTYVQQYGSATKKWILLAALGILFVDCHVRAAINVFWGCATMRNKDHRNRTPAGKESSLSPCSATVYVPCPQVLPEVTTVAITGNAAKRSTCHLS